MPFRELITGCSENRAIVEVCCMDIMSGLLNLESGGACSNWYALEQRFPHYFCSRPHFGFEKWPRFFGK